MINLLPFRECSSRLPFKLTVIVIGESAAENDVKGAETDVIEDFEIFFSVVE